MIFETMISPDELKKKVVSRDIYLWGARHAYNTQKVLERNGLAIQGFIDSSPSLENTTMNEKTIYSPAKFFNSEMSNNAFIVVTSGFYFDEISDECAKEGMVHGEDFISYTEMQMFDYQVDISGTCNLQCVSCPRGNEPEHRSTGFMKIDTYKQVVDKILREDPYAGIVTLYNWGEPLLNKDLPEIIRYTSEKGLSTAISSNLSFKKDFSEVIKAGPTWFRVSASGWEDGYEITHTKGSWKLFYENVHKLAKLRDEHSPDTIVELFYHLYKHSVGEPYEKMKALCEELGFLFRVRHAALAPLDNVERVIDGKELSAEAQKTREVQLFPVEEVMEIAQEQKDKPCFYERCLWITWDLQVPQCMEWYKPGLNLVPKSFLDTPIADFVQARKVNSFCDACKSKGIHRAYVVYADEKLIESRRSLKEKAK